MRNRSCYGQAAAAVAAAGFDAQHGIRDVAIADLRMNGRLMRSLPEAAIRRRPTRADVRIEAP